MPCGQEPKPKHPAPHRPHPKGQRPDPGCPFLSPGPLPLRPCSGVCPPALRGCHSKSPAPRVVRHSRSQSAVGQTGKERGEPMSVRDPGTQKPSWCPSGPAQVSDPTSSSRARPPWAPPQDFRGSPSVLCAPSSLLKRVTCREARAFLLLCRGCGLGHTRGHTLLPSHVTVAAGNKAPRCSCTQL